MPFTYIIKSSHNASTTLLKDRQNLIKSKVYLLLSGGKNNISQVNKHTFLNWQSYLRHLLDKFSCYQPMLNHHSSHRAVAFQGLSCWHAAMTNSYLATICKEKIGLGVHREASETHFSSNIHTQHTHNHFTALLEYVRDHPGEQVPER